MFLQIIYQFISNIKNKASLTLGDILDKTVKKLLTLRLPISNGDPLDICSIISIEDQKKKIRKMNVTNHINANLLFEKKRLS